MEEERIYHIADKFDDVIQAGKERWKRDKDFALKFVPTIDRTIWGLKRKNLVVVAGRPSQGKSNFMINAAWCQAKQGKTVLFFTLEMSIEQCIERIISNELNIENTKLQTGAAYNDDSIDIDKFREQIEQSPLVLLENEGKTLPDLEKRIQGFTKPDIIFIDYINMIKAPLNNRRAAMDEYIKDLRYLTKKLNLCAVVGAQINRETHKNQDTEPSVPSMWHLKETGSLEEVADLIFIVHWPFKYKYELEGEKYEKEEYIIKIAKNRDGRTGQFSCRFQPEFCRISEYYSESQPTML